MADEVAAARAQRIMERGREYDQKQQDAFARYTAVYDRDGSTDEERAAAYANLTRAQEALDRAYADVLKYRQQLDVKDLREMAVAGLSGEIAKLIGEYGEDEAAEMTREAVVQARQSVAAERD